MKIPITFKSGSLIYDTPGELKNEIIVEANITYDNIQDIIKSSLTDSLSDTFSLFIQSRPLTGSLQDFLDENSDISTETAIIIEFYPGPAKNTPTSVGFTVDAVVDLCWYNGYLLALGNLGHLTVFKPAISTTEDQYEKICVIHSPEDSVLRLCSVDNGKFISFTSSGVCVLYDVDSAISEKRNCDAKILFESTINATGYSTFALNNAHDLLLACSLDGKVDFFSLPDNRVSEPAAPVKRYNVHKAAITSIRVIEDVTSGTFSILTTSMDSRIVLTDLIDGTIQCSCSNSSSVLSAYYNVNGVLLVGDELGFLRRWKVNNRKLVCVSEYRLPSKHAVTTISMDSTDVHGLVSVSSDDATIFVFNSDAKQLLYKLSYDSMVPQKGRSLVDYKVSCLCIATIDGEHSKVILYVGTLRNEVISFILSQN